MVRLMGHNTISMNIEQIHGWKRLLIPVDYVVNYMASGAIVIGVTMGDPHKFESFVYWATSFYLWMRK